MNNLYISNKKNSFDFDLIFSIDIYVIVMHSGRKIRERKL